MFSLGFRMKKIAVMSLGLIMAVSAQAGLYRWVDDAGNVHFSDKVPAAASKKSHTKFNKAGGLTGQVEPESKQKALDLKKAKNREKEKLAEIARIKSEAQAVIQKRDDDLLSTYSDEEELINYFESKIKMVEGNTKILEAQKNVLNKKKIKLEDKAINTKQEKSLKTIVKNIVNIDNTLEQYEKALAENDKQITQLSENYQNNLARFKELTE